MKVSQAPHLPKLETRAFLDRELIVCHNFPPRVSLNWNFFLPLKCCVLGSRARSIISNAPSNCRNVIGKVSEKPSVTEPLESPVRIVALVGKGAVSPLKDASWEEVMLHTATRLKWIDEEFEMVVFNDEMCLSSDESALNLQKELKSAMILVIIGVNNQESVRWIQDSSANIPNLISFESSASFKNKLGGTYVQRGLKGGKFRFSEPRESKEATEIAETVSDAWNRYNSDDIRFSLLVIINAYIKPVAILKNLRSKGFSTLSCMVKNCGPQILNCLLDPNCRKAIQCLNQCSPVDQVCNYRCIASYESPYLEAFSLCVLQKHNCLELDAKIPEKPCVLPMTEFRGKALSQETAEDLFVGWLGRLNWSWRVVAGQNPAYDQFSCQYQLFYRGKAKGSFWYEPIFKVRSLEGNMIWRRRRYRVKGEKTPGTFNFSVLDNGVISNEFWTIVHVSDDLTWGLFHYNGAARAAGQSYTGAVLVSPDGSYPKGRERERLQSALESCGIKEWEMFTVDNSYCENAPLGLPEGSRLHSSLDIKDLNQPLLEKI